MSGASGIIRKVFDISPTAITSNGNFDGSGTPTTAWSSGAVNPIWLSNLTQSDADNGRVGQSIALETFDIRIRISPATTVAGYAHLRMLILADNECDGVAPAFTDVLGDANNGGTTLATGYEMQWNQPAFFGRFNIIEDKNWYWYTATPGAPYTEASIPHPLYHEAHHDMKSHRIMWDNTDASLIANARKGHIFMYFLFTNNVTAAGGLPAITVANPPSIQYTTRMRYRDA